ncbi:MAG: hypothetical protein DIZ80_00025 [endosymbiont of Galathealinum brachiosum]|uniref:Uncharacterized protein n=1 Tax=endosymbiont of Galathealinum brachiosum TaxID=2200906 RepID=A0A370DMV3_9GAMM|nr:MAG: hypothetical protein DIZ80_00025 [endosymbiont of Galathealinum brachiosum]
MLNKTLSVVILSAFSAASYASSNLCKEVGGMGLAEAINETNLVAALSGDFTGARAEIIGQKKTSTGLVLEMEHFFINDKNGLIRTRDKATLTTVPGKDETYMLEIAYKIVDSRGTYEGYRGGFNSFGLIKLEKGEVILRYQGEICK